MTNACCENKDNREPEKISDALAVQRCKVCGRRHYEVSADPLQVGLTFT